MSVNRDLAINVINTLSEEKINAFITLFADENTMARFESDMLASDPNSKKYSSFGEFRKEMERENA